MQVTKTEKDRQVELKIELSVEEVAPFIEKVAKDAQKEMAIEGFRKGKVPLDMVKKQIGEETLWKDAFLDVVNDTLPKAIDQEKLEVVGSPAIDLEKMAPGNPLIYKAKIDLMPNVKLGDYKTLKAKKKPVEVDQKAVDETLDALREMRASEKIVLREAKDGDKAMIDFEIKVDGVVIEGGEAKDAPVFLGKGNFLPEIETNVLGMSAGEEKEFTMKFPDDYFKKDIAGKDAQAKVKVNGVYEIEKPELTDEFAQALGEFKNFEELKAKVTENMKAEAEMKEKQRLEIEILEEIIEKAEFDPFPEAMIDGEVHKMIHELQHDLSSKGLAWAEYLKHLKKTEEEIKEDFKEKAEKRLKVAIATRAIAKEEGIEVSNAEIAAEIEKAKEMYKDTPEQTAQFDTEDFKTYVKAFLTNQKTFEKLTSYIKD